jgi:hypothetical protein
MQNTNINSINPIREIQLNLEYRQLQLNKKIKLFKRVSRNTIDQILISQTNVSTKTYNFFNNQYKKNNYEISRLKNRVSVGINDFSIVFQPTVNYLNKNILFLTNISNNFIQKTISQTISFIKFLSDKLKNSILTKNSTNVKSITKVFTTVIISILSITVVTKFIEAIQIFQKPIPEQNFQTNTLKNFND